MNLIHKKYRVLSALLAFFLFLMVCLPTGVLAAGNAEVTITADKNQVSKGDKVKVTVTVSGDSTLDKVNYTLVYDKAVLSIKDSEGYDFNGKLRWSAAQVGSSRYVESFTFTAVADGSASIHFADIPEVSGFTVTAGDPCVIKVGSGAAVQPDDEVPPTSSNSDVSVVIPNESQTPEETETESNLGPCDLKNLVIKPGVLEFDPAVTEYVVQVEAGTQRIVVQAETADPTSQYVVSGFESLKDGQENLISVIVTSAAGDTKTYNLHVLCGDAVYYEDFTVTVGEKNFTVKEFPSADLVPSTYTETSITIGENTAHAFQNEKTSQMGFYLIYAAEGEGSPVVSWYEAGSGSIFPYIEVGNPEAEVSLAEVQGAYTALSEKYNTDMSFRMKIIIGLVVVVAFVLVITIVQMIKIHRLENELMEMEEAQEAMEQKKAAAAEKKVSKKPEGKKEAPKKETTAKEAPKKAPVKKTEQEAVKAAPKKASVQKATLDMDTQDISAAILANMDMSGISSAKKVEEEEDEFFFEEVKKVVKPAAKKEAPVAKTPEKKAAEVVAPRRPTRERPKKPEVTRK